MNGRKVPGAGQAVLLRSDGHRDLLAVNLEFARADEALVGSLLKQPSISTTYPVTLLAAASYRARTPGGRQCLRLATCRVPRHRRRLRRRRRAGAHPTY